MKIDRNSYIPIHEQLEHLLLAQIKTEKLEPGDKLESVRSLSAKHGLCLATVQKSINALTRRGILESKRGRGLFITEKDTTQDLEHSKRTLAFISTYAVDDLKTMMYSSDFLVGMMGELEKCKYDLLYVTPRDDLGQNEPVQLTDLKAREKDFAGIVTLVYNGKYLYSMNTLDYPVVVADYDMNYANLDCVVFDNRTAASDLTKKMINRGAKYILYVGFEHNLINGKAVIIDEAIWDRHSGVKQAIREHSLPEFKDQFLKTYNKSENLAKVVKTISEMEITPDAIIASDADLAYKIADSLSKKNLKSFKNILFGGFFTCTNRNIQMEKYLSFNVMADGTAMGKESIKLLIDRIENPNTPVKKITIPMEVIEY